MVSSLARMIVVGFPLAGLAGCGAVQPDRGTGAANAPAVSGGLAGPQEGNPGNAHNIGTDPTDVAK